MSLRSLVALSLVCLSIFCVSIAHSDEYSILARTGVTVPIGEDLIYQSLLLSGTLELPAPRISQFGQTLYHTRLGGSGAPAGLNYAVIRAENDTRMSVFRQGLQAPGLPSGVYLAGFSNLVMNAAGESTYVASLYGSGVLSGVNDRAVFAETPLGLQFLIRDGTPLPLAGYPAASVDWLEGNFLTDPNVGGSAIMSGRINGTGLGNGLDVVLRQNGSEFTPTILGNTQLQDAPPGTLFLSTDPVVGPSGIVVYETTLYGPAVGTVNVNGVPINTNKALVVGEGADQRTLARSGYQVQTEPAGIAFSLIFGGSSRRGFNTSGDFAFSASMVGPGIFTSNNWGIWLKRGGELTRVARLSDPAPLLGATYGSFPLASGASFVKLADSGATIFTAMLLGGGATTSSNGTIIYAHDASQTLVARAGVDIPSLPPGVRIKNSSLGLGVKTSTQGHVAIAAQLEGTGVTSANDVAVFLWSPDEPQNLRLICREGDVLGEYRIKTLSPAGTDLQVNAVGEIIFSAVVDKTDAAELGKTALFTASLTTPARIFAVQGGSISSDQGSIILSSLKLGSSEALNDSGEVVISAGITSPNPNDEAVIKIRLQDQMQCHADFNGDGIVNVDDLFAFLSAWFAQSMSADFDGSGDIDVPDIFLFLTVWFEGC